MLAVVVNEEHECWGNYRKMHTDHGCILNTMDQTGSESES